MNLESYLKGVKFVFHFGSNVPFANYDYSLEHVVEDVKNMNKLISLCAKQSSIKIIYPSSKIAEEPTTFYALTKYVCEEMLKCSKIKHCIVRIPPCFGPGQRKTGYVYGLVQKFLKQKKNIEKDIENTKRPYIYIDELINNLLFTMKLENTVNCVVNMDLFRGRVYKFIDYFRLKIYFDLDGTIIDVSNRAKTRGKFVESWDVFQHDNLLPGVKKTLKKLSKDSGVKLILLTKRKNVSLLVKQLIIMKILNYFDEIYYTSGRPKHKYIRELNNAIIVGDTEDDILTGKKLKIDTVAVLSGVRTKEMLLKYKPSIIIKDITKLKVKK
jgi:histidinol phosphatase-like enzyme